MNIVDSSGWLEYFGRGPNALIFAPVITNTADLIVPVISIYEVSKWIMRQSSESEALQAVSDMSQGKVVELDLPTALTAARLSIDHKLLMADSMMLASAYTYGATLWTQDADFKAIPGVHFVEKK